MTYLTISDIADIKAIKAQYINDADLNELRAFLKKNDTEITTVNRINTKTVWNVILDSFTDSVINHSAHKTYKDNNPLIGFGNAKEEKAYVVQNYLPELNPKLDRLYDLAYSLNFDDAGRFISQKTEQLKGFNVESFLLTSDYDFKPFSIDAVDAELVKNTIAINSAVAKFFEQFTKELNSDQKAILSKNLFETINFFVTNSTPAIKKTDEQFKTLVEYVNSQSN